MSFIRALDISANGLYAQKKKMEVISQNIANADTLVTENGEPYRKQYTLMSEIRDRDFHSALDNFSQPRNGKGVSVQVITGMQEPFKMLYDPDHPLANEEGYVRMPNVNTTEEMIDMLAATRAYEANVTVMDATKEMFKKTMEIMK